MIKKGACLISSAPCLVTPGEALTVPWEVAGSESCQPHGDVRQADDLRVQGIEAASPSALKKPRSQVHDVAPSQTE